MHLEDNLIRVSVAATRRIGDAMDGAGNRRTAAVSTYYNTDGSSRMMRWHWEGYCRITVAVTNSDTSPRIESLLG